ncbi:hypothetical protein [uncultured Methylobacterium sp.]
MKLTQIGGWPNVQRMLAGVASRDGAAGEAVHTPLPHTLAQIDFGRG